jgi:hypothetical protein
MPRCASPLASLGVLLSKNMQNVAAPKPRSSVCNTLFVYKQREGDVRLLAKQPCIGGIAQTHGRKLRPSLFEIALVFTQLRDVLPAEDSSVMAKENDDRRMPLPKRADLHLAPARIGQNDTRKSFCERGHRREVHYM